MCAILTLFYNMTKLCTGEIKNLIVLFVYSSSVAMISVLQTFSQDPEVLYKTEIVVKNFAAGKN